MVADSENVDYVKRLDDERFWIRANAAENLGELKEEKAIPRLLEAMDDSVGEVGTEAAKALMKIGLDKLNRDDRTRCLLRVADQRAESGGKGAVPSLVKALHDPNETIRRNAEVGLCNIVSQCRAISDVVEFERVVDTSLEECARSRKAAKKAVPRVESAIDACKGYLARAMEDRFSPGTVKPPARRKARAQDRGPKPISRYRY